ncbi:MULTISPECIES: AbrB/MazE/SpoVT family DNA-binding domain-containing protein [unclassified Paenibacillus]|uniref:AbrB/MazE/SpoVT family DNA-binding domain-containing protein n=1 Tax=unclassified Paenibacillus TaxID=185978 RepID=UPI00277DF6D9|nr:MULTISPECIES: AbrB/MazE/SpoVT family DNA-binding domain-containing protein [unclassified Paenibacillus]MDQ0896316.1 bifunctional DNA-binding transcriptional regulator/antitoxin component of YhaV-PrlF toxin-antitoxin module [Paenibacillus sp. V4I7]MDQ0913757.1 bifunctional DNA-binding transcriptional regulator/antitoxin component of YhaV-PrlF toxin-antitoxin module [Paenibacillus sp. V4I5]
MSKNQRVMPRSAETVRQTMMTFLNGCIDGMETLRDREWVSKELDKLRNPAKAVEGSTAARQIKSTGVVRAVDELGRIVIPMELRRTMNIGHKEELDIYVEGSWIIIEKLDKEEKWCRFCKSENDLNEFMGGYICEPCVGKLFDTEEEAATNE